MLVKRDYLILSKQVSQDENRGGDGGKIAKMQNTLKFGEKVSISEIDAMV